MTFINPLGLLGLIGVPIIIIIYILRNKFNEQTVPSTYIWTLSEKFFKRRNPLSGITGLISLILQLLLVVTVSLAIARPVFTVPDSAGEYCFVIDGSGSMNMVSGGRSRFERAKDEIAELIGSSSDGSTYTLVSVAGETTTVYERLTDKKLATDMLRELECSDGSVSYSDAIGTAQKYFDENRSFIVYLVTDKNVERHNGVEIVNVSLQNEYNYSISDVSSGFVSGNLSVDAEIAAHGKDASFELLLYVNGSEQPVAREEVSIPSGDSQTVSFEYSVQSYESFRVVIPEADALASDNEFVGYNHKSENSYSILVVSETPFFLQAALDALTDAEVDTVSPDKYDGKEGYGLYIFQSYTPKELPDAAVWIINSQENVPDSGFGARGVIELDDPAAIVKSNSTSTTAEKLLLGIAGGGIYISEYVKYSGMYTKFTTLFSYESNPLIFAGVNGLGNREVVIGFDLHKADFALSTDFVALLGNLLAYSCPDVVDRVGYTCGEDVYVNITSQMTNIKAVAPDGEEIYIDNSADIGSFALDRVGTYTIELVQSGERKSYKIFSATPEEEGIPVSGEDGFSLAGEREYEMSDGQFDPVVIIFILLALTFTADWMVYCYEKYQLR